jgi:hypothetical protein
MSTSQKPCQTHSRDSDVTQEPQNILLLFYTPVIPDFNLEKEQDELREMSEHS